MKIDSQRKSLSGVSFALIAAVLFGASTPFSKLLLGKTEPVLLAGLLYLGSGIGLGVLWSLRFLFKGRKSDEANLTFAAAPWLAGAILSGGVIGPVLLLIGLANTPASTTSLLLNLEGVFTAALAWFVFKENFDNRIAFGMAAIVAGGLILSWAGRPQFGVPWGPIAIGGACLAWAIDNNLTRKVSGGDPLQIAGAKGLVAGAVNLTIGLRMGAKLPNWPSVGTASLVGFLGYGISLTLFVLALRHIGTARTGAYFSTAPFVGAIISILLFGDHISISFIVAATLMIVGLWLHLTERHGHEHKHLPMEHTHKHIHDEHHRHEHDGQEPATEPHSHSHGHEELIHSHPHYPDIHHRHEH